MRIGILSLILVFGVGCFAPSYRPGEWPIGIPGVSHYQKIYDERGEDVETVTSKEDYLTWVLRFYKGWPPIAPKGWEWTEEHVLKKVAMEKYPVLKAKLSYLGHLISGEWALGGKIRRVHTGMLILWSDLIQKAESDNDKEAIVDLVTDEVLALLSDQIAPNEITKERYKDDGSKTLKSFMIDAPR